jgi:hypothetical protein
MRKNVSLPIIATLALAGLAACEFADTDDDPATRPAYDRDSSDRVAPERVPEQEPETGEPVNEKPPAEDVSDMP